MGIGPGPIPPDTKNLVIQFKLFGTLDDLTEENINKITDDTIELLHLRTFYVRGYCYLCN